MRLALLASSDDTRKTLRASPLLLISAADFTTLRFLFNRKWRGVWNMFSSRIRFDRKFIFAAVATLIAAISLTMAPAARAINDVPDAMPTGTETVLYSFGEGPTAGKCKINDGADPT